MGRVMKGLFRWLVYAAIFVAFAGVGGYLVTRLFVRSTGEVVVPDLTGRDMAMALEQLTREGLGLKLKGFRYSETIGRNLVVDQEPLPGATVRSGRDVFVVISQGTQKVVVPAVTGMELSRAAFVLEENGLARGKVARIYLAEGKKDRVVAQEPGPHREVARFTKVNLLVSLGPRPPRLAMPELRGKATTDALALLGDLGLRADELKEGFLAGIEEDTVISQHPLSGYMVTEGARVSLTVNRKAGPKSAGGLVPLEFTLFPVPGTLEVEVFAVKRAARRELYRARHAGGETVFLVLRLEPKEEFRVFVNGEPLEKEYLTEVMTW